MCCNQHVAQEGCDVRFLLGAVIGFLFGAVYGVIYAVQVPDSALAKAVTIAKIIGRVME